MKLHEIIKKSLLMTGAAPALSVTQAITDTYSTSSADAWTQNGDTLVFDSEVH